MARPDDPATVHDIIVTNMFTTVIAKALIKKGVINKADINTEIGVLHDQDIAPPLKMELVRLLSTVAKW